jgi:opacity protein-like surface antigen
LHLHRLLVFAFVAAACSSVNVARAGDPPADFTGPYLGISTGYGFGAGGDWCFCSPVPAAADAAEGEGGIVVGGEAGYGVRFGLVVVEAGVRASYADIGFFENSCAGALACSGELAWLGEAQVSVGVVIGDVLVAGGIGYAAGDVHADIGPSSTSTSTHDGRVLSVRLEQGMSDGWRMGLEYRYYDMSGTNDLAGAPVDFDWTTQSAAFTIRYELPN